MDATIGGHLMLVFDDRLDLPGERRIRPSLAVVVAGFGQVPEMVDHAGADESCSLAIPGHPPGVARPFANRFEVARPRMNAKHGAGEVVVLRPRCSTSLRIEDPVQSVEPAIGAPRQRIRQLVRVGPAEAGDDHFRLVRLAVAVGVLHEQDVGRVGDPYAAVSDSDPDGMFSPSAKTVNLSALPSPSVSSRILTRSRPGPGSGADIRNSR